MAQQHDCDAAEREADQTRALAPYDAFTNGDLSTIDLLCGRYDQAVASALSAITHDPQLRNPRWGSSGEVISLSSPGEYPPKARHPWAMIRKSLGLGRSWRPDSLPSFWRHTRLSLLNLGEKHEFELFFTVLSEPCLMNSIGRAKLCTG